MTRRERLLRALEGHAVSPRAVLCLGPCQQADGVCLPLDAIPAASDQARLAVVRGVFEQARTRAMDLLGLLESDPIAGEAMVERMVEEADGEMRDACEAGADGVLYQLSGACAEWSTPLTYGGHFLEAERSVLARAAGFDRPVVVHVLGESDLYLDLLGDLPCAGMAWDSAASRLSFEEVRRYFPGALISDVPEADVGWMVAGAPQSDRVARTGVVA